MLKEAIYHIFVAEIWYSDAGMLPARLLPRVSPTTPTPMSSLDQTWMVTAFFIIWAVVSLLLLLGWQSRVMSVLNLILLVSVINRNQLVVTGADGVMQALAFWSVFLPLACCYSLDARRRPRNPKPTTFAFPVRMFQIQVALIYIFTAIYKLQGTTWPSGDALYMAMQVRMHTFPVAEWLLANASMDVLHLLTHIALLIECTFALLVFLPVLQPYLRRIGLVAGVLLHVGIGLVMNIPNFPLVMIISYAMFLDAGLMDWIERHLLAQETVSPAVDVPATSKAKEASGCLGALMAIPRGMAVGAYRGLLACALAVMMGVIIWGNLLGNDPLATQVNVPAMPGALESDLRVIGLWQSWALFAPDPITREGWFGVNGVFPNADIHDLRDLADRPRWYLGPLARWGKLEENLMMKDSDDPVFSAWAFYNCQQFQTEGILSVQIVLYSRTTSPPGQPFLPYQSTLVHTESCS